MQNAAPRNFTAEAASLGAARPQARAARMAARRAFVEAKQRFMASVAHLEDEPGRWLQHQIRQAQEPVDLWLLRSAVYRALTDGTPAGHTQRGELHRFLDTAFPGRSGRMTLF